MKNEFFHPLMENNILEQDINSLIQWLSDPNGIPKLTNGNMVRKFEEQWSQWVGCKYSVFVNSGSSANHLTMMALKYLYGGGEVILPPLTWISDVSAVISAGFTPVFCDINMKNLSFDIDMLQSLITDQTRIIFPTHVLGINAMTDELLDIVAQGDGKIKLIEDGCESHGALFRGQQIGTFSYASNFSFYYAHHMSTIEGGMVCTNDEIFYNICKSLRSHGMSRELDDPIMKSTVESTHPDLNPDFIFIAPAHNFRSTEINAVIGLNQLKRLDQNNHRRRRNHRTFFHHLDPNYFITDLDFTGQCSYAFPIILKNQDIKLRDHLESRMKDKGIEFRRGLSGGGNQMRQPYFVENNYNFDFTKYPNIEHIHRYSWYIGNYPSLDIDRIIFIANAINSIVDEYYYS